MLLQGLMASQKRPSCCLMVLVGAAAQMHAMSDHGEWRSLVQLLAGSHGLSVPAHLHALPDSGSVYLLQCL